MTGPLQLASAREPALAVHRAAMARGWYVVEADITGIRSGAAVAARLGILDTASRGVAPDIPVPALSLGKWSFVFALDRATDGMALFADGPACGLAVANLRIARLSRAAAILRMLVSADSGGPGLRGSGRSMLWAVAGQLLRGSVHGAGAAVVAHYRASLVSPDRILPCQVQRAWWHPHRQIGGFVPAGDLQHCDAPDLAAWDASAEDPQFLLPRANLGVPLAKGWYLLAGRFSIDEGAVSSPCLYPDYGPGTSQADAIALPDPDCDGWMRRVVMFQHDVHALRFDPSTRPARFNLTDVGMRRLSRLEAAVRMLRAFAADERDLGGLIRAISRKGLSAAATLLHQRYQGLLGPGVADYAAWVRQYDTIRPADLPALHRRAQVLGDGPMISLLLPVYETPEQWLRKCIDSVLGQAYPHWELCIADDASPNPHVQKVLQEYARRDPRVRVVRRGSNGHISAASNSALEIARGDYVALLDHDDELRPHALLEIAEALARSPQVRLVYSDEDKIDEDGRRFQPYFKPDWNPDLLLSQNYLCHLTAISTALVREVGGFREGFEGSQDHDLVLRCTERLALDEIHHVPRVLYHWRAVAGSTALERGAKDYAAQAGVRAVRDHLSRVGAAACVDELPHGHCRVRWQVPEPPPLVSLIIPTRDRAGLLRTCVDSILRLTTYPAFEVVIVDNQSSEPDALEYLDSLAGEPRVKVLRYDAPFNYSAINNFAVARSSGAVIALVNNDIEVTQGDWLYEMVGHAQRPDVGAVGAMLYYPDGTIQHAGVILGIGGIANHPYMRQPRGYPGHGARALVAQNLSAVTGACLFVRRALYEELGGLDEDLAVAFNDIDFCLRVRERGYRNVWTPFCELVHHESASRGKDDTPAKAARFMAEVDFMHRRWGAVLAADPAYNPNLTLAGIDFELAFPPRPSNADLA